VITKNKILPTLMFSFLLSQGAFSATTDSSYILVTPDCLINKFDAPYQTLSHNKNFSLIKLNVENFTKLIGVRNSQKTLCGGFINVTDAYNSSHFSNENSALFLEKYIPKTSISKKQFNYGINHTKEVNQLLALLNPDEMWKNLTKLSSYTDRYANSDTGLGAARWIKSQVEQIAKDNGRTDVTTSIINTGTSYKQPSVVVKIGNSTKPAVVVGAHMDTLSSFWGNMPGADDDGTGSVTVLELARVLLSSSMHFQKPIYLIWYSAEEEGLVGSQYVVAEFKKDNIPVEEVIHFDMTGYTPNNDKTMWLLSDNTDKELTSYLELLINTYIKKPLKYTKCGYACSDHATWTNNGYKAAIAFEAEDGKYNPYIHTSQDTMSQLSLEHMTDFTKLAIAFTGELADPVS